MSSFGGGRLPHTHRQSYMTICQMRAGHVACACLAMYPCCRNHTHAHKNNCQALVLFSLPSDWPVHGRQPALAQPRLQARLQRRLRVGAAGWPAVQSWVATMEGVGGHNRSRAHTSAAPLTPPAQSHATQHGEPQTPYPTQIGKRACRAFSRAFQPADLQLRALEARLPLVAVVISGAQRQRGADGQIPDVRA